MRKGKLIGVLLLIAVSSALLLIGARWVHFRLTHAVTNAVFVESDSLTRVAYRRVGGRIVELYREEGDRVRKGDPLAKLEDRDLRLKIEELRR
ncbi:MAG TPA: biotin/lipoyl-binding protein, partial [Aquifex aeolicus]|nr:biotin/lipoyl-binding protein [Aquifex aeolicus]